ncbi:hypothetical protein SUGI_0223700 [Cryptomeria japonica]|nr:hypothetical protein SUGI_0223700 [Cryptomeria japonica]
MENSCDSFWKWGNARKKMTFTKASCIEGGSKFGGPCSNLGTPVGSSGMEVNLSNSKYKNNEVSCNKSTPTSVIGALQTSSTDSDTISCHPHVELNPQCFPHSDEKLLQDGNLNDKKELSELRMREMDKKAGSGDGCFKIQKENPESFAGLNMLADVAVWVLQNDYKEDDKAMASLGQWQIISPSGAPSSNKILIKRVRNDYKSLCPELPSHARKLLPSLSEHLLERKLGSPRCSLKHQYIQVKEHGLADKDKVENPNVRRSKRNRAQYLSYNPRTSIKSGSYDCALLFHGDLPPSHDPVDIFFHLSFYPCLRLLQGLRMLVDDIGDVTITNDRATILKMLEVEHPAANVLVELAKSEDQEVRNGTTSIVIIVAELLKRANDLVRNKIHPTSIISGYRLAMREACKYINDKLAVKVEKLGKDSLINCAKTSMS